MLKFYWTLGADIVRLEKDQPWGSKFMQRVSADLKAWMPEAKCFSRVNLYYMVRFFKLYMPAEIIHQLGERLKLPSEGDGNGALQIVQQVAEQFPLTQFESTFPVPWRHHIVIMDKFGEDQECSEVTPLNHIKTARSRT